MSEDKRTIKGEKKKAESLRIKHGEVKFGIQDWRGLIAAFVIFSYILMFGIALLWFRDTQAATLVATTFSIPVGTIITWYFFIKSKEEEKHGSKET